MVRYKKHLIFHPQQTSKYGRKCKWCDEPIKQEQKSIELRLSGGVGKQFFHFPKCYKDFIKFLCDKPTEQVQVLPSKDFHLMELLNKNKRS